MKPWDIFFGICAFLIISTMMIPQVFGLQNYKQWGGMYIDGWCSAWGYGLDFNPSKDADPLAIIEERVVTPNSTITWSSPQHNAKSCIRWAQSWCNKAYRDKIEIIELYPFYAGKYITDTGVCNSGDFANEPAWFIQDKQL